MQWCDRRNLAEAHRRTLAILRDRGAPVSAAQLALFLLERHRAPDVAAAASMLAGFRTPLETLERDLLWRRVPGYLPPLLDAVCATGELGWWLDGTKVAVAPRAEMTTWCAPAPSDPRDDAETAVLRALDERGAMFGPELLAATKLAPSALFDAVWALARRGVVTNDAYDAVRRAALADFGAEKAGVDPASARLSIRQLARAARRSPWIGRFSRVLTAPLSSEERALRQVATLLRRYGVVGKPVADAEPGCAPWSDLEAVLHDLELRGEVTRGQFVDGLGPWQVALADTVDDLRAPRDASAIALINACDPANPYGALTSRSEGRIARIPSSYLVLRGGAPLLLVEGYGKRITPLAEADDDTFAAALASLKALLAVPAPLRGFRSITVHTFGDREAASVEPLFRRAGFERDYDRMVMTAL